MRNLIPEYSVIKPIVSSDSPIGISNGTRIISAVVGVVIQAETMSLVGIVEKQIEWGVPFVVGGQVVGFLIFMVAATAEMMRVPFDMPIGESELTGFYDRILWY